MDPVDVVTRLWERFEARDWDAAAELLHEDVIVEWPQTGERIVGRENVLAVNRNYPEGWSIHVERVWPAGPSRAVALVRVPFRGTTEWAASFAELRDGKIWRVLETWAAQGPAPEWRAHWVEAL